MYDAGEDPYCYPGTTVLKNKLNLKAQRDLDAFEAEIVAQGPRDLFRPAS